MLGQGLLNKIKHFQGLDLKVLDFNYIKFKHCQAPGCMSTVKHMLRNLMGGATRILGKFFSTSFELSTSPCTEMITNLPYMYYMLAK